MNKKQIKAKMSCLNENDIKSNIEVNQLKTDANDLKNDIIITINIQILEIMKWCPFFIYLSFYIRFRLGVLEWLLPQKKKIKLNENSKIQTNKHIDNLFKTKYKMNHSKKLHFKINKNL